MGMMERAKEERDRGREGEREGGRKIDGRETEKEIERKRRKDEKDGGEGSERNQGVVL